MFQCVHAKIVTRIFWPGLQFSHTGKTTKWAVHVNGVIDLTVRGRIGVCGRGKGRNRGGGCSGGGESRGGEGCNGGSGYGGRWAGMRWQRGIPWRQPMQWRRMRWRQRTKRQQKWWRRGMRQLQQRKKTNYNFTPLTRWCQGPRCRQWSNFLIDVYSKNSGSARYGEQHV